MADALEKDRVSFTGKMASMSRREAWSLVCANGGEPALYVSHRTTILVVGTRGWPLLPNGQISRKLSYAKALREAGCPIRIVPEPAFLEIIGRVSQGPAPGKTFPAGEVCRVLGITAETLRRWERLVLIRSRDGLYDFQDLVSIQTIQELVRGGIRPDKIAASLHNLETLLPGLDRPLTQLRVFAENPDMLLVDLGGVRFSSTGQLLLDFEGRVRARGIVLTLDPHARASKEWLDLGIGCEEEGLYSDACEAFRAALALDPHSAPAYFHLGNVMREMGILWAAEEFYGTAAKMEPGMVCAWGSLAGVQEEQGKTEEAIASYRQALAAAPDYADGHFNLALCLEGAGQRPDACEHWFAYLKLDPGSPSAQVARRHLSVQAGS
jgi:tetratricopeptide (TPR) repeat protein